MTHYDRITINLIKQLNLFLLSSLYYLVKRYTDTLE